MIIGIDTSRANKQKRTGTEWYAYYIIEKLKIIDKQNQYFLYSNESLREDLKIMPSNFQEKVLSWPFKYIWTHFRLSWEMFINPPDILFVPAHSVPLIHRNRTIVTIHDLGFLHNSEIYHPLARLYHRLSAWWSIKFAKKIITISNFTKQDIVKRYKINSQKITVIPLGIDYNKYKLQDKNDIARVEKECNLTKKYFFYLGRLEKKKNIKFLIQVFEEFSKINPGYELVLGGRYGFGGEEIKELIEKNKNIKVLGYVKDQNVPPLMTGAEAFLFPSLFEGFGLPILEAMACGCPVICSNVTSLPEVGADACWYFNPQNKQELIKLMNKIVKDKEARQELINKGLLRVKKYTWDITAQKTYEELMKNINL